MRWVKVRGIPWVLSGVAIIGSILVNALFVLGLVLVAGARREPDGIMRFSPRLPNDTATLLLVASLIFLLVGIVANTHGAAGHHIKTISIISAVALLVVYGFWVRQYLTSKHPEDSASEAPRLSTRASLAMASTAAIFIASLIVVAQTSSAPRKMNGKHKTLLTWLA